MKNRPTEQKLLDGFKVAAFNRCYVSQHEGETIYWSYRSWSGTITNRENADRIGFHTSFYAPIRYVPLGKTLNAGQQAKLAEIEEGEPWLE